MAKFRIKLKKVGKTTRLVRYDLNPIPYECKWRWQTDSRDWIQQTDSLQNNTQRPVVLYRRRRERPSQKKEKQEGKGLVWGGFTSSWGKKRSEKQGRKGKVQPTKRGVPEDSTEGQMAFFNEQCRETEEDNRGERREVSSRKWETSKEHFIQRWAQ